MPWLGLLATLGWNYARHRRGRSTMCSVTRRALPFPAVALGWGVLTGWLLRHLHGGYPR